VIVTFLMNCIIMRFRSLFIINKKCGTLTLGDETSTVLGIFEVG